MGGIDGRMDREMKYGLRTGNKWSRGGWERECRGRRNRGMRDGWMDGGREGGREG